MKKILLILGVFAGVIMASCSDGGSSGGGDKPVTANIPSTDKTVLEGRAPGASAVSVSARSAVSARSVAPAPLAAGELGGEIPVNTEGQGAGREYTLLERLYSTTWYRSEKEYDDGRLEEIEEEFLYFDENSRMCKREYENGRPDDTDYAKLTCLKSFRTNEREDNKNANACIVLNEEMGDDDRDVEGYYLPDENTLYVIDGDDENIMRKLAELISRVERDGDFKGYDHDDDDIDRYILSTVSEPIR